jgi:hypothetical protein
VDHSEFMVHGFVGDYASEFYFFEDVYSMKALYIYPTKDFRPKINRGPPNLSPGLLCLRFFFANFNALPDGGQLAF